MITLNMRFVVFVCEVGYLHNLNWKRRVLHFFFSESFFLFVMLNTFVPTNISVNLECDI